MTLNGPDLWRQILSPINDTFGRAIIAGGAVRDWHLGVYPKDIDVFVNVNEDTLEAGSYALQSGDDFEDVRMLSDESISEYLNNPDWVHEVSGVIEMTFNVEGGGPLAIQIVGRPMPDFSGHALVSRFDLAITRSWFDGDKVVDLPEAEADRANKTLTLMRWDTPHHVEATMRRVERFRHRFPGYRFVDPRPVQVAA